jgi:hypothetical protein
VNEKTPIPPPDWEALIEVIAKEIIDERSPARILQVRAKLYDLLTHCIPATTILKVSRAMATVMLRRPKADDRWLDSYIQAHAKIGRQPQNRSCEVERIL